MYEINVVYIAHESNLLLSPFLAVDCKRSLCLFVLLGPEKKVVCCKSGSSHAKTEQSNLMQGAEEGWMWMVGIPTAASLALAVATGVMQYLQCFSSSPVASVPL
jgi:hypothetical protein